MYHHLGGGVFLPGNHSWTRTARQNQNREEQETWKATDLGSAAECAGAENERWCAPQPVMLDVAQTIQDAAVTGEDETGIVPKDIELETVRPGGGGPLRTPKGCHTVSV